MPLIKDGQLADDTWRALDDHETVDAAAAVIVSLERWQAEREALAGRLGPLGIRLRSDQPPHLIADDLSHFALVALEFPAFTDGRAYSYARLLRQRYGFSGEVRAVGDVLRDQLLFLHRCGFDAFEMTGASALDDWREAVAEFSAFYQPAADARPSATTLRHGRLAAE